MSYFTPLYILITAINAVILLLPNGFSLNQMLLALYVAVAASLALAAGERVRRIIRRAGPVMQKASDLVLLIVLLVVAAWLARHFSISLYITRVGGLLWVAIGVVLGLLADKGLPPLRKKR